ncbi:MAG TPA: hypothetical protein VLT61_00575 [Anaeromyxobacteraceae bacterium]|nr:hypothetical protein [Anaeromyxobacteraceae bacterium]
MKDPAQHPDARSLPPAPAAEDQDLFELGLIRDYVGFVLRAASRHRVLAAATFGAVLTLAIVALNTVPIRWQVQASLLAQRSQLMDAISNPGLNRDWDAPSRSARDVVMRRENLLALCKQTNFVDRYLAGRAPAVRLRDWLFGLLGAEEVTREERLDALVDGMDEWLWVTSTAEGKVTITFVWPDKDLAFAMVEAAVQSFMEQRYVSEITVVGETISILEGHDASVQKEIANSITLLERKERALRIRTTPRAVPALRARVDGDEDLARLENTLTARRRALNDLEDYRARRMVELQSQLAQLLGVYAAGHPAVVGAQRAVESASQPSPQIDALRLEVQELERQVRQRGGQAGGSAATALAVQGELDDLARVRLETADPRLEYERRQLDVQLRQHSHLLERIAAARVEMDTAKAAFKYRYSVISPPQLPRKPVKPYLMIFLLGGLVGGAALALFVSTVADLRAGRVLERWQVERDLELPVLAELRR